MTHALKALIVLPLLLLSSCSPEKNEAVPAQVRPWVSLHSSSAPVHSILDSIASQSRKDIRFSKDLTDELDLHLEVPWDVALEAVTCATGLHAEWVGESLHVGREAGEGVELTARPFHESDRPWPWKTRVKRSQLDLTLRDAPLREALAIVSDQIGVAIEVDPDLDAKVTESLRGLEWRFALDCMSKAYLFEIEETAKGLLVRPINCGVYMDFEEEVRLRLVLELIGAYGANLVAKPEVERERELHARGLNRALLEQVSEQFGVSVEFRLGVAIVAPQPVGW